MASGSALFFLSLKPSTLLLLGAVGLRGLEPRTSTLSVSRSNHLSYKPAVFSACRSVVCLSIFLQSGQLAYLITQENKRE